MSNFEQQLLRFSYFLGASTIFTHLITRMADYHIPGLLFGGTSLTLLLSLWSIINSYTLLRHTSILNVEATI